MAVEHWDIEIKKKISDGVRAHYKSMSAEERQAINDKMKATRQYKEKVWKFFNSNKDYFKRIAEWKRDKEMKQ